MIILFVYVAVLHCAVGLHTCCHVNDAVGPETVFTINIKKHSHPQRNLLLTNLEIEIAPDSYIL